MLSNVLLSVFFSLIKITKSRIPIAAAKHQQHLHCVHTCTYVIVRALFCNCVYLQRKSLIKIHTRFHWTTELKKKKSASTLGILRSISLSFYLSHRKNYFYFRRKQENSAIIYLKKSNMTSFY